MHKTVNVPTYMQNVMSVKKNTILRNKLREQARRIYNKTKASLPRDFFRQIYDKMHHQSYSIFLKFLFLAELGLFFFVYNIATAL